MCRRSSVVKIKVLYQKTKKLYQFKQKNVWFLITPPPPGSKNLKIGSYAFYVLKFISAKNNIYMYFGLGFIDV